MKDQTSEENLETPGMDRRKALARLGLAAGVIYTAPTIVHLDRSANAKVLASSCPPDQKCKGKGGK